MCFLGLLNCIFIRIPIIALFILLFNLKKGFAHKVKVFALLIGMAFFNFITLVEPPRRSHPSSSFQQKCYTNQRLIQGAIEMYFMDHYTKMTSLDLSLLVKEKYLKGEPKKPTDKCEYYLIDEDEVGYVSCKEHGSCMAKASKKQEEEKTISNKTIKYFSFYDNNLRNSEDKLRGVLEIIDKIPVLGRIIALFLFYLVYLVFGFTISMTNQSYLITSIITLFVIAFEYVATKYEMNNTKTNNEPIK